MVFSKQDKQCLLFTFVYVCLGLFTKPGFRKQLRSIVFINTQGGGVEKHRCLDGWFAGSIDDERAPPRALVLWPVAWLNECGCAHMLCVRLHDLHHVEKRIQRPGHIECHRAGRITNCSVGVPRGLDSLDHKIRDKLLRPWSAYFAARATC